MEASGTLRNELTALQADNVKLYEKFRYMESYRQQSTNGAAPRLGNQFGGPSKRDEELGKYRSLYEESMNPFEVFRGREQNRAVQALNPLEKLLFGLASLVLGRRVMRNLFVVYVMALHLFVMYALYQWTTASDTCRAASGPLRPGDVPVGR